MSLALDEAKHVSLSQRRVDRRMFVPSPRSRRRAGRHVAVTLSVCTVPFEGWLFCPLGLELGQPGVENPPGPGDGFSVLFGETQALFAPAAQLGPG